MMGIHHSTFYRWRRQAERYGLEMLRPPRQVGWHHACCERRLARPEAWLRPSVVRLAV